MALMNMAKYRLFNNMEDGIVDCDVIITLRIQNERIDSPALSSQAEFYKMYRLKQRAFSSSKTGLYRDASGPNEPWR